jgi:hypothetical protein
MGISTLRQIVLPFGIAAYLTSTLWGTSALAQQHNSDRAEFPGRRIGGGTRGECLAGRQPLVALNPANNLGVTTNDAPSVYFLMPALNETLQVEFILRDSSETSVYKTAFDVNTTEEIVGIRLPEGQLKADQDYHWYFSVICDPEDRSQNVVLTGWLRRVSSEIESPEIENQSDLESSLERVMLYQESGLWTDAIATLVELHQTYPHDNEILSQWTQLLQLLELDTVVELPLAVQL